MHGTRTLGSTRWTRLGRLAAAGVLGIGVAAVGGVSDHPGSVVQAGAETAARSDAALVIRLERSGPSEDWSLRIQGTIGSAEFDYEGRVRSAWEVHTVREVRSVRGGRVESEVTDRRRVRGVRDASEMDIEPELPCVGQLDELVPGWRGVVAAAISRPAPNLSTLTILIKEPDEPARDTAPDQAAPDSEAYPMTTTTRLSPALRMRDPDSGVWLDAQDSYLALARRFGLERQSLQDLIAYRLDAGEVAEAFHGGRPDAPTRVDPEQIMVGLEGRREIRFHKIRFGEPTVPGIRIEIRSDIQGPITELTEMERMLEGRLSDSVERIKAGAGPR